jgi:catecholate siderophore receptor
MKGANAAPLTAGAVLSLSAAMLMPAGAHAQEVVEQLATVKVEDTAIDPNPNAQLGVPYKARTSGDERHARPLAETPQTITVLTKSEIDDSGYTDLARILDAQPGMTVGTGENGNAFGDRYIIRGQEARSDVFVDGLRDPGMTTRESFAIEQLEISKGPNSTFAGRGTSGGAVNAITKQANTAYDFGKATLAVGTDQHTRATLDVNHSFGDTFAVRANVLYAYEEIPDRAPADRERKGLALSGLYSPTDEFSLTLDYYGLRASDNPDLGSYLTSRRPTRNVPVYAQQQDFQDSDVDAFTARLKYQITPRLRVTNLTRYGESDNGYVVTGARGTTTSAAAPGGAYLSASLSTHQGWQQVEYFANQTNFFLDAQLFGLEHDVVFGLEYTDHKVLNGIYRVTNAGAFNCATGTSTTLNAFCAIAPNGGAVNGLNTLMNRQIAKGPWDIDWAVQTTSAYVMDTVDLTDRLTVFAGVRADKFDFDLGVQNTNTLARTAYAYSDTLWNGHVGVTYKVGKGGVVYASYASAADINGGESDVGASSGYGGTVIYNGQVAGAKPERSINLELGTKWNVLEERLLLTAALFQSTKSDVMEGANYDSVGTFNTGKSRVRGVEFGVTGAVTEALTLQGGVTLMDSEVLESATPANVGKTLSNFADYSAVLQARYQLTENVYFGGAVKYKSKRYGGQPDTAAGVAADGAYAQPVPAYTVVDLFASYRLNKDLEARLNIGNAMNEDYYLAVYRSGSFLYKGDGRNVRLTLTYEF